MLYGLKQFKDSSFILYYMEIHKIENELLPLVVDYFKSYSKHYLEIVDMTSQSLVPA